MDKRVEIQFGISPDLEGLQQAEQKIKDGLDRLQSIAGDQGSFSMPEGTTVPASAQQSSVPSPPSAPAPAGGSASDVAGSLERLQARLADLQNIAGSAPSIAKYGAGQMQHEVMQSALADPANAGQYQELVDSLKSLTGSFKEESKGRNGLADTLNWIRANALMQMGGQAIGDVQQGRFFSAGGGLLGGALGMIAGPAGMAFGASAGRGIGGMIEGLIGGTSGVRGYEKNITDIAGQFGDYGNLSELRNYQLGNRYGYKAEETAGMFDRLRSGNVIDSAAEGTPVVVAMQELTRALGMNAEATIDLYTGYVQTGGDRGAEGARSYMAEVVGGAIESGFEGNIQQYAEMMNSSRSQIVMQSATAVGDRAFDRMNDIMASITGGDTATSRLFRDNPQMAQQGLATFMQMGGTTDPYGQAAGFMRLAGIGEGQIDRRFTSADQQQANAMTMTNFISARMQEMSGMSAGEFQAGAQNDPEFVRRQLQQNVALQRQVGDVYLPGILGREATAGDIRTFEQLSNIAIANGGQLPGAGESGSDEVNKLLEQLSATPADAARQAEAERHNKQMEVMSHFQNLMTRTDEWMANIYDYILKFDLDAIEDKIMGVMDWIEKHTPGVVEAVEKFAGIGIDKMIEVGEKITEIAGDVKEWLDKHDISGRVGAVGRAVGGAARGAWNAPGNIQERLENDDDFRNLGRMRWFRDDRDRGGRLGLFRNQRQADDEFGDTPPGGIVAEEGYNLFRFRPGDRVTAQNGAPPGVTTGTGSPLDQLEIQIGVGFQQLGQEHQEIVENWKQMHERDDKWYEIAIATQANTNKMAEEHWPEYFKQFGEHLKTVVAIQEQLGILEKGFPAVIGLLGGISGMLEYIGSSGGMGGGGGYGGGADGGSAGGIAGFTGTEQSQQYRSTLAAQQYGASRGGGSRRHAGIDLDISGNDATAISFIGGEVTHVGNNPGGYGHYVDIFNEQTGKVERIAEAAELLVQVGDRIRPGQAVGRGESETGVIHYEIRNDADAQGRGGYGYGGTVDPVAYLKEQHGIDMYAAPDQVFAGANISMAEHHPGDGHNHGADPAMSVAGSAISAGASRGSAPTGGAVGNYNPNVSREFAQEVNAMASRLGTNPAYLMAAMGFETGGSYSPSERNQAGSGATGLIQFMPSTARGMGTSTGALAGMSQMEQLRYVERYLGDHKGNLNSLEDVYMSILYPAAIGRGAGHGLFQRGSTAYRQNAGLDVNRDGTVTVGEATEKVRAFLPSNDAIQRLGINAGAGSGGVYNSGNTINVTVNSGGGDPAAIRAAAQAGASRALDEFNGAWSAGRQQQSAPSGTY